MAVKELTLADAQRFLTNTGAEPVRVEGNAKVFVSKKLGITITQFPTARPGVVKLSLVKGCAC
jgi:hypothetical protein